MGEIKHNHEFEKQHRPSLTVLLHSSINCELETITEIACACNKPFLEEMKCIFLIVFGCGFFLFFCFFVLFCFVLFCFFGESENGFVI